MVAQFVFETNWMTIYPLILMVTTWFQKFNASTTLIVTLTKQRLIFIVIVAKSTVNTPEL